MLKFSLLYEIVGVGPMRLFKSDSGLPFMSGSITRTMGCLSTGSVIKDHLGTDVAVHSWNSETETE